MTGLHLTDFSTYGSEPSLEQIEAWEAIKEVVTPIGPDLFISGYPTERVYAQLQDYRVSCLISLTNAEPPRLPGIRVHRFPLNDALEIDYEKVNLAAELVHDKLLHSEKVAVHCAYGLNRAPLVATYGLYKLLSGAIPNFSAGVIAEKIRAERTGALHNPAFYQWITENFAQPH